MKEYRVFGPPGTGKTTEMATRFIPRSADKFGADNIMVTSFTKAAAREITYKRSRDTGQRIPVPPENVGTLHSMIYHALNKPQITEVHFIDDWNEKYPAWEISGGKVQSMDESCSTASSTTRGDMYLNAVNIQRNRMQSMLPSKDGFGWNAEIRKFFDVWSQFKNETNSIDFTDMIETGLKDFDKAPCDPEVIFVDEAQDFTQLQLSVVRNWGKHAKWIVLVGDDDQTIYEFTGADPTAFLKPAIDAKYKTVLSQSWRVPRSVLTRSQSLIQRVSFREEKDYAPRKEKDGSEAIGDVRDLSYGYKDAEQVIDDMQSYLDDDKTIKILGSCSYMIDPIKMELRERAIPFHNPYRKRRRDWNPLGSHRFDQGNALVDFLSNGLDAPYWNVPQFISWAKHIKVGPDGLARVVGKKALARLEEAVEAAEPGLHTTREVVSMIFSEGVANKALARDVNWFKANLGKGKANQLDYAIRVYQKNNNDLEVLEAPPKVTIGTIHSVKGAEADVVYLFPDISYQADQEMHSTEGQDSAYRLFYVGMTRAKETLVCCRPVVMMRKVTHGVPRMYVNI